VNAQGIVTLLVIALTVLVVVLAVGVVMAVRIVARLSNRIEVTLARMQEETTATLRQAHVTLERVEILAHSSNELLRDQVAPALDMTRTTLVHMEASARGINQSVDRIQRVVRAVAAITGPGAAAVIAQSVYKRGGKLGLVALGLGAGLKAFFGNEGRQDRSPSRR
jgi:uncharacterized protein YoxC